MHLWGCGTADSTSTPDSPAHSDSNSNSVNDRTTSVTGPNDSDSQLLAKQVAVEQLKDALDAVGNESAPSLTSTEEVALALKYVEQRLSVPNANNEYVTDAYEALATAARKHVDNVEVQTQLGQLAYRVGKPAVTRKCAERLLALDNQNESARTLHIRALMADEKFDEALESLNEMIKQNPESLRARMQKYQVQHDTRVPKSDILRDAFTQAEQNGSQRWRILPAIAATVVGEREIAIVEILGLAEDTPLDEEHTRLMLNLMTAWGFRVEADDYLATAVQNCDADSQLRSIHSARLWDKGDLEAFVKFTAQPNTDDVSLRVLRILALTMLRKSDQAADEVNTLPKTDDVAEWKPMLMAMVANDGRGDQDALRQRSRNPGPASENAIRYFIAGVVLRSDGETQAALTAFRRANELRPDWVLPGIEHARILKQAGRTSEAFEIAMNVLRRAPQNAIALQLVSQLQTDLLLADSTETSAEQLKSLRSIQGRLAGFTTPDSSTLLLAATCDVLIHEGTINERDIAASTAAEQRLPILLAKLLALADQSTSLSPRQHQQLLDLASRVSSDATKSIRERMLANNNQTSESAYAWSADSFGNGVSPEQVLAQFDTMAGKQSNKIQWKLGRAKLMDRMSVDSGDAWRDLVTDSSATAQVLVASLSSPTIRDNIQLRERCLERLKEFQGKGSMLATIETARLMLDKADNQNEVAHAAELVLRVVRSTPDHVDARVLLSACYARLDAVDKAISELETAVGIVEKNDMLRLKLALLLEEHDRSAAATTHWQYLALNVDRLLTQVDGASIATQLQSLAESPDDTGHDFAVAQLYCVTLVSSNQAATAAKIAKTHLPQQRWMSLWLALGRRSASDSDAFLAWFGKPDLPSSLTPQQSWLIVRAWFEAADQLQANELKTMAATRLNVLCENPDAPTAALLNLAVLKHSDQTNSENQTESESLYRRILERKPNHPVACNNLADLLAEDKDRLAEAELYVRRALSERPAQKEFDQTLQRIKVLRAAVAKALDAAI